MLLIMHRNSSSVLFGKLLLLFSVISWASHVLASPYSSKGEIGVEYRVFKDDENPNSQDWGLGAFSRLEAVYKEDQFYNVFRAMARVDAKDPGRNFVTIEDGYFSTRLFESGDIMLLGGYKIFNWTATEAFHPADQVNSRNYDGELENLEKKGELTVQVEFPLYEGTFSFYLFPRFEEPQLPSKSSRLGGAGVDIGRAVVLDGDDAETNQYWVPQFGARVVQYLSWADFSFYALRHINRNYPILGTQDYAFVPIFFSEFLLPLSEEVQPYYVPSWQFGGTAQILLDPFILKIEAAHYMYDSHKPIFDLARYALDQTISDEEKLREKEDHTEVAAGLEYALDHENGAQSMFLLEATSIFGLEKEERQRAAIFQRDLFLGYRYAFNDVDGREILLSAITDLERSDERLYNVTFSQRLGNLWRVRSALRVYDADQKESIPQGLELLDKSSGLSLVLTRFF